MRTCRRPVERPHRGDGAGHGAPAGRRRPHRPAGRGLPGCPVRVVHRARPAGQRVTLAGVAAPVRRRPRSRGRRGARCWSAGGAPSAERRTTTRTPTPLDAGALGAQAAFLDRSLADADAEYLAGDLSDQDYLALRRRDMARLAALGTPATTGRGQSRAPRRRRGPDRRVPTGPTCRPTRRRPICGRGRGGAPRATARTARRRWWFLGGAVAAFGAALVLSVSLFATDRLPGQSATGSIASARASSSTRHWPRRPPTRTQGDLGQAAQLYQSVLAAHPDNEVALAQLGWLEFETGRPGTTARSSATGGPSSPGPSSSTPATMPSGSTSGPSFSSRMTTPPGRWPSTAVPGRRTAGGPGPTGDPGDQRRLPEGGPSASFGAGRRLRRRVEAADLLSHGWIHGDAGQSSAAAISEKAVAPSIDSRTMSA